RIHTRHVLDRHVQHLADAIDDVVRRIAQHQLGSHPVALDLQRPQTTRAQQVGLEVRVLIAGQGLFYSGAVNLRHGVHPMGKQYPTCYCLERRLTTPQSGQGVTDSAASSLALSAWSSSGCVGDSPGAMLSLVSVVGTGSSADSGAPSSTSSSNALSRFSPRSPTMSTNTSRTGRLRSRNTARSSGVRRMTSMSLFSVMMFSRSVFSRVWTS